MCCLPLRRGTICDDGGGTMRLFVGEDCLVVVGVVSVDYWY